MISGYAIMRWKKLATPQRMLDAAAHNNREYRVLNADEQAPHPNVEFVEFVESARRSYEEMANARIAEVVTRTVRKDAVKVMEGIFTASPEAFNRGPDGRADNYADSQWAKDVLSFVKDTYGERNVLSCRLHQDEHTPHFHVIVVPITADNRLSAKALFNKSTLRQYQTDYAKAMAPHGQQRGVEHSQAVHQPMKKFYGQTRQQARQAGQQPVAYQPVQVEAPGRVQLDPVAWAQKQSARVNEHAQRQVEAANARADRFQQQAADNSAATGQVRTLRQQLHTSEQQTQTQRRGWQQETASGDELARRLAGGEVPPAEWVARGNRLLDEDACAVWEGRRQLDQLRQEEKMAEKAGDYERVAELRYGPILNAEAGQQTRELELGRYQGGTARLAELQARWEQEQAEQLRQQQAAAEQQERERRQREEREQAAAKRWEEAKRKFDEQARKDAQQAAELAARQEQERVAAQQRWQQEAEQQRQQVERLSAELLTTNPHIYNTQHFTRAAEQQGLQVERLSGHELRLTLKGSPHHFLSTGLHLEGQDFATFFHAKIKANNERVAQEVAREQRSRGFGIGD